MSDATSVDATSVLFSLEDDFDVLRVERVDAATVGIRAALPNALIAVDSGI